MQIKLEMTRDKSILGQEKKIEKVPTFTAAQCILEVLKDEYTKERERTVILDNKAMAMATALLAILTLYIPIIPFDKVLLISKNGTVAERVILSLALLGLITSLIVSLIELAIILMALGIQKYMRVDINDLCQDAILRVDEDVVERELVLHYQKLILTNSKVNDDKANKVRTAFSLLIVIFTLLLLSAVALSFMSGGIG